MEPVAYSSRAMTNTEQRYAQIEREALAVTWACERFTNYLLGMTFEIETDHKPLVSLLGKKPIDELPLRIQRFKMRLMKYQYSISHVPGKADALSRAPSSKTTLDDANFSTEVNAYVNAVMNTLPATDKIDRIRNEQNHDRNCVQVTKYCQDGWSNRNQLDNDLKPFHSVSTELSVQNGLLMRNSRIVIPKSLQPDILQKLHNGHQGITKCRARARNSVWWPGISKDLETEVKKCTACCKAQMQVTEPLIPTQFPQLPWQRVGTDLFEHNASNYVLVVDYFSRYIEIAKLSSTDANTVVNHLKSIFARHGIPQVIISDNGPQYSAAVFSKFAEDYGFVHMTSSPKYPQANGEAERVVRTIKSLLKKCSGKAEDPYLALMAYRATPLACGYSPAELLMGRAIRTTVPISSGKLTPAVPDLAILREQEKRTNDQQKNEFDCRHRARSLTPLNHGDRVWLPSEQMSATVLANAGERSYELSTYTGNIIRRNS